MSAPPAPAVERELAWDMVRRGLPAIPVVVAVAYFWRGVDGAASAALGVGIVAVNLALSALALSWAARRSLNLLMVTALGGFAVRMGLVTLAVFAVRNQPWADLHALGVTVLVTHLGLLFWELRFVSASLAFPGLAPRGADRRSEFKEITAS